jgi:hypothetical protein
MNSLIATELEVNLTPTVVAAQEVGAITWDLPASLQYQPDTDLVAEVKVVNTYSTAMVFAVALVVADENRVILDEQLLDFTQDSSTFNSFQLEPNHALEFTLTARFNRTGIYFALLLYVCKQVDTTWELDEIADSVEVWLASAAAGIDISQIMMLMIPVMMIGIMMPVMTKATKS